jgi:hypothetical protein
MFSRHQLVGNMPLSSSRPAVTELAHAAVGGTAVIAGIASINAQRTRAGPCLVMGPRRTLVSLSRWRGVNPAHEHSAGADRNRAMSPISATRIAAMVGPIPWMAGHHRVHLGLQP